MTSRGPIPVRRQFAVAVLALCVATAVAGAVGHGDVARPAAGADPADAAGADDSARADATLVVASVDADERATGSGERLLELPVADGDEVVLSYTHSVEKTPVEDVYAVDGPDLRMDRTVFSSFGAGLPSTAEMNRTEDGFVVSVDRTYDRVYVSTGSIAGHELLVGDRCYDLVERSGGGTVVLFVEPGPPDESAVPPDESAAPGGESANRPLDPPERSTDPTAEPAERRGECP